MVIFVNSGKHDGSIFLEIMHNVIDNSPGIIRLHNPKHTDTAPPTAAHSTPSCPF